jgi:nitrogen regulatory protein A
MTAQIAPGRSGRIKPNERRMREVENVRNLVQKELDLLRELIGADVAAVAWKRKEDGKWAWWAASGCADDRYRKLTIRLGRGLEGSVTRIGRPLVLDGNDPDTARKREESPLMLVEQLQAAAAYPIAGSAEVHGVLLVGHRQLLAYSQENLLVVQLSARWLGQLRDYGETEFPIHFTPSS